MKNKRYSVRFRRDREKRTDYKRRSKMLLSGIPRVIIRKTLKRIIVQVAEPEKEGDRIIFTVDSNMLKRKGWRYWPNICTSYLTGFMAGAVAREREKRVLIPDFGGNAHKGGNIYAALKGMIDAGVEIKHDPSVFPKEERLRGKHLKKENVEKEIESVMKSIRERT